MRGQATALVTHPALVKLTRGGKMRIANQPFPLARFPSIPKPNTWCRGSTETTSRAKPARRPHTHRPTALTLLGCTVKTSVSVCMCVIVRVFVCVCL